jgi:hypothetical protein
VAEKKKVSQHMAEFNQQRAIEDWTELHRRISVGAYSERSAEHFETGTYPEDGIEESIDNLTELAARHGLEFIWRNNAWGLETMSEETRAARQEAQEYQEDEEGEDEEDTDDGSGLHQCPYCYNLVNAEHEEFCRLNPNRNREIVP